LPVVVNGKLYKREVNFPPFEPVVYETVRTYCRKPFMLDEHLRRLKISARIVGIEDIPKKSAIEKYLEIASRGIENEVYYRIYLRKNGDVVIESSEISDNQVKADLEFSPFRKLKAIPPQLKIVGRTDVLLARIRKKTYDVLMLNEEGYLAEGSFSNVFLVYEGRLITPSLETGILSGITRELVIKLARNTGIDVEERFVLPWEVFRADEIFLTHTSRGIVPVFRVEWKMYEAPGTVTKRLTSIFKSFVMELC
jgi:branched-chain amino acid aminotransferase